MQTLGHFFDPLYDCGSSCSQWFLLSRGNWWHNFKTQVCGFLSCPIPGKIQEESPHHQIHRSEGSCRTWRWRLGEYWGTQYSKVSRGCKGALMAVLGTLFLIFLFSFILLTIYLHTFLFQLSIVFCGRVYLPLLDFQATNTIRQKGPSALAAYLLLLISFFLF